MSRVFILSSGSIFSMGVESLICRMSGVEIVGSSGDLARSIESIKDTQPDVLILDKDGWPGGLPTELVALLEQEEPIRIVGLSIQDNAICSYRKERRVITTVEDLVEAIR